MKLKLTLAALSVATTVTVATGFAMAHAAVWFPLVGRRGHGW